MMSTVIQAHYGWWQNETKDGDSVDKIIFLHLKHLGQINRRPRSIESRARALKRLFRFAGNLGLTVIELSLKELEEFLDRPPVPSVAGDRNFSPKKLLSLVSRRRFREHRPISPIA